VTVVASLVTYTASAEPFFVDSDAADSYHFVDAYEIVIDRTPEVVWPILVDQSLWTDFEMIHESGPRNAEGEVLRLYPGQDFFVQIVNLIPERMMVVANLPSTMEGEASIGLAMLTLADLGGKTLVSNFMVRYYDWTADGPNPLRARRESAEYQAFNREMWQERYLPRLRELAEAGP
jgi:hypothetical protein